MPTGILELLKTARNNRPYIFLVISDFAKIRKIFRLAPVWEVSDVFEISKIFRLREFANFVRENKDMELMFIIYIRQPTRIEWVARGDLASPWAL